MVAKLSLTCAAGAKRSKRAMNWSNDARQCAILQLWVPKLQRGEEVLLLLLLLLCVVVVCCCVSLFVVVWRCLVLFVVVCCCVLLRVVHFRHFVVHRCCRSFAFSCQRKRFQAFSHLRKKTSCLSSLLMLEKTHVLPVRLCCLCKTRTGRTSAPNISRPHPEPVSCLSKQKLDFAKVCLSVGNCCFCIPSKFCCLCQCVFRPSESNRDFPKVFLNKC